MSNTQTPAKKTKKPKQTMGMKELVYAIQDELSRSSSDYASRKQIQNTLEVAFHLINKQLRKGTPVSLSSLGTFSVHQHQSKPWRGSNTTTPTSTQLEIRFQPSKLFRDDIEAHIKRAQVAPAPTTT
jgi:nucleoid DNA-binding protein